MGRRHHLSQGGWHLSLPGGGDGQVQPPHRGLELRSQKRREVNAAALDRAVRARRPGSAIVFHTDLGFTQSMNRPGKLTDNAFVESFFHSMKSEVFHGYRFNEDDEVRATLKSYLPFYNQTRLHSSLNYVSPATFERQVK